MMATVSSSDNYNRKRPRRLSSSTGASSTTASVAGHPAPTPLTITHDQQHFHRNPSSIHNTSYIRKKQQQYPTTSNLNSNSTSNSNSNYKNLDYNSLDIINLDSDAEDYAFKDELPELPTPTRTTHRSHPISYQPTTSTTNSKTDDFSYFETVIDEDDEDFEFDDNNNNMGFDEDTQSTSSSASSFSYNSFNLLNLKLGNTAIQNTPPPLINKKKIRTSFLPQLQYAKLNYISNLNKLEVLQKIGDIKATVIQHSPNNYTYQQQVPEYNSRKFSFNTDVPSNFSTTTFQQQQQNYSNSSESTTSSSGLTTQSTLTSVDDTPCDDKDGHYVINPGSFFANDRYQIQSLLGQGTFGKVIKAYDRYNDDIVAIKIIRAIPKYREASKIELRVLSMLKKHDPANVNQCIHLRECFDYRDHICIVTDILKISLYDFLDKNQFLSFPGSHIQGIAKQLLVSVSFMHDLNLIHTDLKPENILLKNDSYIKKPYHKPGYSKTYYRKILVDPKIYTIDFGSAIFNDEYHSSIVSTRHYRAPEIILGIGWSFPCDMWSIGCILVELLTGDALFKTHENVQHMALMEKVLSEPMDLTLVRKCFNQFYHDNSSNTAGYHVRRRSSVSSSSNSNINDCIANSFSKKTGRLLFPTSKTPQKLKDEVDQLQNLAEIIGNKVGFKYSMNLSLKESLSFFKITKKSQNDYEFWFWFIDLVKCMLTYDPDKRINSSDAMNHKWFDCGILDDGTTGGTD